MVTTKNVSLFEADIGKMRVQGKHFLLKIRQTDTHHKKRQKILQINIGYDSLTINKY